MRDAIPAGGWSDNSCGAFRKCSVFRRQACQRKIPRHLGLVNSMAQFLRADILRIKTHFLRNKLTFYE